MENGNVAAATGQGPVTYIEVDGVEYELAPLQMKDLAAVEQHAKKVIRSEALATIREAGDLLTSKEKAAMVKDLSTESRSWLDFLGSPTGIEYVIVIRLRKAHPEMTEEAARDLITVRALADVQAEMSELVGLEVFKSMGGDGESPPATEG